MKLVTPALLALAPALALGCGSSSPAPADPEPAAKAPAQTLHIAPVEVVMSSTRSDGQSQEMTIRVDAAGKLSATRDGETRELATVQPDGRIVFEGEGAPTIQLAADGSLSVNGETLPIRIAEDGTLYRGEQAMLSIENGAVVDRSPEGDILTSRVVVNGEEVSRAEHQIRVQADEQSKRLAGLVLALNFIVSGDEAPPPPSAAPGAEPVPEPAPQPAPTP
jgi:uncharacterized protein YfaP (DUF2135 family)